MKYSRRTKTRHERESLPELICRLTDIPADLFSQGMTLEMRGRNELLLCGCREITEYSESVVRVVQGSCNIVVGGRRLSMSSFSEGRISVTGEIDYLDFLGGECIGKKA